MTASLAEPRGLQVAGEPPVLAVLDLAVDEQAEPLLERSAA